MLPPTSLEPPRPLPNAEAMGSAIDLVEERQTRRKEEETALGVSELGSALPVDDVDERVAMEDLWEEMNDGAMDDNGNFTLMSALPDYEDVSR